MYSWDDQELANIIWGEADDHIVPYPEESEKGTQSDFKYCDNNETPEKSANPALFEQKPAGTKPKLHGGKQESNYASRSEGGSWTGKETDLEKGSEISKVHNEDRELGDIISNTWANIGTSNDLDCIFSNNALVDHANLDRADELLTSSRDVVMSSSLALDSTSWGLKPIRNSSGQFGFDTEYHLNIKSQSYTNRFEKPADSTCYTQGRLLSSFDEGEIACTAQPNLILEKHTISEPQAVTRKVASAGKVSKKNKWPTSQSMHELKSVKMTNDKEPQDLYDTWLLPDANVQKFDTHSMPDKSNLYLSSVLEKESKPQESSCLPYQHFMHPYFPAYSDGNLSDQCTSMSILPESDEKHQALLPNPAAFLNERVLIGKSMDTPMKSQSMTPKQKIEKLRRRQRMHALLGIKKQQQQLSHPVQITDYSNAQKITEDYSSAISMEGVDHNVEDTVLHKLQDEVMKLDTQMRLSIRDSLFRLAQSAMQRSHASDSNSGHRQPDILEENTRTQESLMQTPSTETGTNHIDRTVARLLFHQPHNSTSKHTRTSTGVPLSFVTKTSESEQPQTDVIRNRRMKQKMLESAD